MFSLYKLRFRPIQNGTTNAEISRRGYIVLLKTDPNRNQWPIAKVIGVNADEMGFVRSIRLLLASSCDSAGERVLEQPIHKIALIKEAEV